MSDFQRARHATILSTRADMAIDAGLRSFMIGVYNKVALGLLVSAALAYLTSSVPPVRDLMFVTSADGHLAGMTPIGWIVAIAPLGILLVSGFAMRNPTSGAASALYWTIVALIGASQGRSGAGHWVAGRYHPVSGEVLANTLAPGALAPQRQTDLANYAGIEVGDPQPRAQGMLRHRLRAREAVRGAIRAAVLAGDRPGDTVTVRPLNDCPLTHEKPAALDAGPGRQRADPLRAMERVAIHRQRQAAPAGMRRSAADLSAHTDNRAGAAPSSQHTQEMRWRPIPPSAATMRAPKCGGPRSMRSVATEAA